MPSSSIPEWLGVFADGRGGSFTVDGQGEATCFICGQRKFRFRLGEDGHLLLSCHSGQCRAASIEGYDEDWFRRVHEKLVLAGVPRSALRLSTRHQDAQALPTPAEMQTVRLPSRDTLERQSDVLLRAIGSGRYRDHPWLTPDLVIEADLGFDADWDNGKGRLVCPVFDPDTDALQTVIYRSLNGASPKSRVAKGTQGRHLYMPFGVHEGKPVLLVGGEKDVFAAFASGLGHEFNLACFTNGDGPPSDVSRSRSLVEMRVVIAGDLDARDKNRKLATWLLDVAKEVRLADLGVHAELLPANGDVFDVITDAALGPSALRKLIGEAKPWVRAEADAEEGAAEVATALRRLEITDSAREQFRAARADADFRTPPSDKSLREMLAREREPQPFTIDRLHPSGSNSLIAAQYKVGKTTLMGNLAKAYADGDKFLGEFPVEPGQGRIALFNYELTEDMLLDQYLIPLGIENPDRVAVLNLRGLNFDLRSPSAFAWAANWLRERECDALILDPFGAAARLQNENDNSEARNWLLGLLDPFKEEAGIRDLWMPAHTGRGLAEEGEEHIRGASAVDDWADVRWLYTKARIPDGNGAGVSRFLSAGGRGVDVPERELGFDAEDHYLYVSEYRNRSQARASSGLSSVVQIVEKSPGIKSSDLREALRVGNRDKGPAIAEAVRQGLVHIVHGERNAKHYYPGQEPLDA